MEKDFLEDPESWVAFSLGCRKGGKTFRVLRCIEHWILKNRFQKFYLILPSFSDEKDGSYDFLMKFKQVEIYPGYYAGIFEEILNNAEKERDKGNYTFCFFDDSTEYGAKLRNDCSFDSLVFRARHKHMSLWIITHAFKKVLAPAVRYNMSYIFVVKVDEFELLDQLYEAYYKIDVHMFKNCREFLEMFVEYVNKVPHGCLFRNNLKGEWNPSAWKWKVLKQKPFSSNIPPKIANKNVHNQPKKEIPKPSPEKL